MLGSIISLKVFGQRFIILNALEEANEIMEKQSAINSDRPYLEMAGRLYANWMDRGSFTQCCPQSALGENIGSPSLWATLQGDQEVHSSNNRRTCCSQVETTDRTIGRENDSCHSRCTIKSSAPHSIVSIDTPRGAVHRTYLTHRDLLARLEGSSSG